MDIHHVELARMAARDRFQRLAFSALPDAPIQPSRRRRRLRRSQI
jgi:hypothetical protein